MTRYVELNIPISDNIPLGYKLILAYAKEDEVIIPIDLDGLEEDQHNCDWEGCTSVSHSQIFNFISYLFNNIFPIFIHSK
jgi:hypothetical protein